MAFTETDISLIRTSWEDYMKGDLVDQGIYMFLRIFEKRPEMKHLWTFSEEDDSVETYKKSPKLRYHVKRLFATLGMVVDGLDFLPELEEVLEDLGKRHNKYKIKQSHFEPVGDGLLYALSRPLGNKFTPETRAAWSKLYGWMSDIMLRQVKG